MHDSTAAADLARRRLEHGRVRIYPEASHAIDGEYLDEIAADWRLPRSGRAQLVSRARLSAGLARGVPLATMVAGAGWESRL
jgi:hypothetical protein